MNTTNSLLIGLVVLVLALGGFYVVSQRDDAAMMEDSAAMDDTMNEEAMDDDAMNNDTMDDVGTMDESMMEKDEGAMMEGAGSYETYSADKLALASAGDVVLFFHADWCPICRSVEAEIKEDPSRIPAGTHILKVDYDTATALKQRYGVTVQHTFVQVDADGNLIAKWSDTSTLAAALGRIQ